MTLPVWTVNPYTPLTIGNIQVEFDGNIPVEFKSYYSDSPDQFVLPNTPGYPLNVETVIPTTGNALGISNFYGASQVPYSITTDKTVYDEGQLITFSITAPDRDGSLLYWTIDDVTVELTITPDLLPTANRGRPYNTTISTSGGIAPYSYAITHGQLPPGLNITPDGRISGITTGAGKYIFNVTSTDSQINSGNKVFTLDVLVPEITISPTSLVNAFQRIPYSQTVVASGGDGNYTYTVTSGNLPAGLGLNSVSGIISGRAQSVGSNTFRITAVDSSQNSGVRDYSIVVEEINIFISPASLPDARQDFSYSQQLSATGGQGPYVWSSLGSMPTGLSISSDGVISGTPTVAGSVSFNILATDVNGNSGNKQYFLKIISNKWEITLNNQNTGPVTVNEGATLNFNIQSPETLEPALTAFLVVGAPLTTDSSDISQSTDAVSITNRSGVGTVQIVADAFTEGAEYFDVWVEYPRGTRKATFGRVNIADTSLTPALTASVNPGTVRGGDSVTLTWSTANPPAGSYVRIERFNSAATNDTTQYSPSGSKSYTSPSTGGTDSLGGGTWTGELKLFLANGFPRLTTSVTYSVDSATYSITPDRVFFYEGQTVTYQITTTNVPNGTTLYWVNSGTTSADDFTDNQMSGTITINNNSASLTRSATTNEGSLTSNVAETIILTLRSGSINGPTLASASTVSLSGLQTFTVTPSKTTANEGEQITWTVDTTSIPNGTTIFWQNIGTTTAADFTENTNSGTLIINNQTGSFIRTLKNDLATETSETVIIQLRVGGAGGTIVATAPTVTVIDTSQTVNEVITGPASTPVTQPITVTITGGVPNTTFSYTGAAVGSGTLDSAGSYTFPNVDYSPNGPGTYTYNFLFNATGHTRTYTIVVTAVPVVPTFTNGSFEITAPVTTNGNVVQIPGWKVYLQSVRLNGFSTIQGNPTPADPTPTPLSATNGDNVPTDAVSFYWEFADDAPGGDGAKVLRLFSSGSTTAFGIVRGPYVVSDSIINAQVGDTAEFWWKAQNGGDWFDVFAYLLNETTGDIIRLLDEIGDVTNWQKVSKTIVSGEEGTYRFIFICGSYDYSGGTALGASLYLDNIKLIKA